VAAKDGEKEERTSFTSSKVYPEVEESSTESSDIKVDQAAKDWNKARLVKRSRENVNPYEGDVEDFKDAEKMQGIANAIRPGEDARERAAARERLMFQRRPQREKAADKKKGSGLNIEDPVDEADASVVNA
jgi:hypothetical protein